MAEICLAAEMRDHDAQTTIRNNHKYLYIFIPNKIDSSYGFKDDNFSLMVHNRSKSWNESKLTALG